MIDRLVAKVFATRNAAHLAHWAAKGNGSYAEHMALGEFYDDVIESIDEIVEVYQGARGLIAVGFEAPRPATPMSEHLLAEATWIAQSKKEIANGVPAVENLLDELCATYLRTVFKLKNLR